MSVTVTAAGAAALLWYWAGNALTAAAKAAMANERILFELLGDS